MPKKYPIVDPDAAVATLNELFDTINATGGRDTVLRRSAATSEHTKPGRGRGLGRSGGSLCAGVSCLGLADADQRISQFSKVPISKVDRQKGFDVEQNAAMRQFYGCHFGSADDLQLGEHLSQSQNTCVGDVGAGEDQCVEAGDGF